MIRAALACVDAVGVDLLRNFSTFPFSTGTAMRRINFALLACSLGGCAGQAAYSVRPFYSPDLHKMVCCEASVSSSRDIASVTVDAAKTGDDYQIHFSETGVSASAPINANTAAVSAVAGAVTATANAAAKLSIK